jgi:MOSC domain-containing protein YiiM
MSDGEDRRESNGGDGVDAGIVLALWLKRSKGGPMDAAQEVELVAGRGLKRNANQGGRRQVTLLDRRRWNEAERALGSEVDPRFRRANVFTDGIDYLQSRGRVLRLGASRVRILGETRPCTLMDEMFPGLQRALDPDWRAGAFAEILDDGLLRVGDAVAWEPVELATPPRES